MLGQLMFRNLGPNKALYVLAAVATLFCGPALIFRLYGRRMRERSPFAEQTWSESSSNEKLVVADSPTSEP